MPLKLQKPRWRFKAPGPIPEAVVSSFTDLVFAIAEQGSPKDVYESFKSAFSGGSSGPSSTLGFAIGDMQDAMSDAAKNAPRFVAAFLDVCEALAREGREVPDIDLVNEILAEHDAGYQIVGNTLVATDEAVSDVAVVPPPKPPAEVKGARIPSTAKIFPPSVTQHPPLMVFLCHSHGDKPVVQALHARLKADGFQPWLDKEDLLPGQKWEFEIKKAVKRSQFVLVCLSQSAVNKTGYVQAEIKYALDLADERPEGTIFIIPVRLEECIVPERLAHFQYVDYFEADGYTKLVRALNTRRTP